MASYGCPMTATMSTTIPVGVTYCAAASPRRFWVFDIVFGCEGTPGDTAMTLRVQRNTAIPTVGNGAAVTPAPLDTADAAAVTLGLSCGTTSAAGTAGANLLEIAQNQRSTVRWFAAPGCELKVPATNSNGLQYLTPTSPALAARVSVFFTE